MPITIILDLTLIYQSRTWCLAFMAKDVAGLPPIRLRRYLGITTR